MSALGCASCRHSGAYLNHSGRVCGLFCRRDIKREMVRCEEFEYEPGTDEEERNADQSGS